MKNIAVVADIHLHDLHGGYGLNDGQGRAFAFRTFEDTVASTRVFNESYPALIATLDDIARRGLRDVVLLGDYSDDGQPAAVAALKEILSHYETRHDLRFFATFGNHDCFGPAAREQAKRLNLGEGRSRTLVTSDEGAAPPAIASPFMRGMSTAEAMKAMADCGLVRPKEVFHWETPFGDRTGLDERYPPGGDPTQPDASYLVEPQEGLWLLVLDANVFSKVEGGWQVEANAAWDHVLARRSYLPGWIEDVARRAARLGKTLLAFSHYPALPLALSGKGSEVAAIGTPEWLSRMPSLESGRRLAKAGLRWHFSGHMHVAGHVTLDGLTNIAVPSPVAYPGGYVIVQVENETVDIETVSMPDTPGFNVAFAAYAAETGTAGAPHPMLDATTYEGFLEAHLRQLVITRHLPKDWPELGDCLDAPHGSPSPVLTALEAYYLHRARGLTASATDELALLHSQKMAFGGNA
ncbi:metallophosphoesterase family protein [Rhizobium sp. C4]|uniref:metallophosphoesterase family protein n=1 Tax=Rhizobium sp. C4 TaxID=1349800 RepID=UPI001E387699|nr:metallophosphoesterase [Rhizobium sp. C4]MCD2173596.1 metallophosphoesterase [Rhizobium sp. C4]